jgi:hypothetical protein
MTNYNYGRYLREALDSALNQTVAAHEVVLVDDGSTDDSRDVLESYGDQIVTVLTENRGYAAAMATALTHCSGEVVAMLDADDLMAPNRVESLVTMYETVPDAQWVFHGLEHIDRETREPLESPPSPAPGFHDERRSFHWGRISLNAPASSALSWRFDCLKRVLPIPDGIVCVDNYLKFATIGLAPGWVMSEPLSQQGIHDTNMYTKVPAADRRIKGLQSAVTMVPALDQLGLQMLAEHLAAQPFVRARGGRELGGDYAEALSSWTGGLSLARKLRFAMFCAATVAERTVDKTRTRMVARRRIYGPSGS